MLGKLGQKSLTYFPKINRCRFINIGSPNQRHVITALVVDEPGSLARISNLFSGRGYNIDSLVVGKTEQPNISRFTIVVNDAGKTVINMKRHLEDVVAVASVDILTGDADTTGEKPFVERDLMLVKVNVTDSQKRNDVVGLTNLFHGEVVDVHPNHMMVQCTSTPSKLDNFLELLRPIGILEMHRTGAIAMAKKDILGAEVDHSILTYEIHQDDSATAVQNMSLPPG